MDASCGPSNALQNLLKHAQNDRSLQNEAARAHAANGSQFRSARNVDPRLNHDFNQFNEMGHPGQMTHSHPMHHITQSPMNQMNQMNQPNAQWVSDFSNMSIAQNQVKQNDWHVQFMNQRKQQSHQQHHQQHQHQHQNHQNLQNHQNFYRPSFQMNMRTDVSSIPTEHKELHQMEQQHQQFEDHFDQIEKELQSEQLESMHPVEDNEADKQRFAETAKQVYNSMASPQPNQSQETSEKFQQSDFLKLMNSISNRQVEISNEGDKLVQTGSNQDIRDHLSDPLKHERSQVPTESDNSRENSQVPMESEVFRERVSQPTTSHLPDPLAHIGDNMLDANEPLQAARIISGGQVKVNDWMEDDSWTPRMRPRGNILSQAEQEVFDDYRHDDDAH